MKKNVAVIGSSGAIGNAVSKILLDDETVQSVYNFSRSINTNTSDKENRIYIDIENEESIKDAVDKIPQDIKFDLIFVATGILHNENDVYPEKSIRDISADKFKKVLMINTVGPALIGKYFIPFLNKDNKNVFAFLSARVGSISDNKLGGWHAYRASKAALNMLIKNFSIELNRTNKLAKVIGLHPGTVDTRLSKPFQRNVPENKLFTPEFAAISMASVISNLHDNESGSIFAFDGSKIDS